MGKMTDLRLMWAQPLFIYSFTRYGALGKVSSHNDWFCENERSSIQGCALEVNSLQNLMEFNLDEYKKVLTMTLIQKALTMVNASFSIESCVWLRGWGSENCSLISMSGWLLHNGVRSQPLFPLGEKERMWIQRGWLQRLLVPVYQKMGKITQKSCFSGPFCTSYWSSFTWAKMTEPMISGSLLIGEQIFNH